MNLFARIALLTFASCAATPPAAPEEQVFFPKPPSSPRIQFLRSISFARDVEPPPATSVKEWLLGADPKPPRPLLAPSGIAQRDGVFYLTDYQLQGIVRIDFGARKVDLAPLGGRAQLQNPRGLCFGPDGELYVADRGRRQVVVLNPDFSWKRELGPWDDRSAPVDVRVDADRIYVADAGATCARVLERSTGKQILELGNAENEDEYMRGPTDVAVDQHGNIYVVDVIYSRIFVWDRAGRFICQMGAPGDAPGHLVRPKGIALDGDKIWILDSAYDNCQILDLTGRPLMYFGGNTGGPGGMNMPRKVWVGKEGLEHFRDRFAEDFVPDRLIAVTNRYGAKLSFYALGKSKKFEYRDVELPQHPSKPKVDDPKRPAEPKK